MTLSRHNQLGHAYQDALDPFSRSHRRIDSTNRMFLRTLQALQDLQSFGQPSQRTETTQPGARFPNRRPPSRLSHFRDNWLGSANRPRIGRPAASAP